VRVTFLGTGDAGRVPVYGCACPACQRALGDPRWQRTAASIEVAGEQGKFIIDAGQVDLPSRYPAGSLDGIVLTHYHIDHVLGLFHLRWGSGAALSVSGPDDSKGCDDLYKHPGILDFRPPLKAFEPFSLAGITLTPVPLRHSRPCFGYLMEHNSCKIAYLTDTVGLARETREFLSKRQPDVMIIDCTHPPTVTSPGNHNNWSMVDSLVNSIRPYKTILTHINHEMDCWLMQNALPAGVITGRDKMSVMGIDVVNNSHPPEARDA